MILNLNNRPSKLIDLKIDDIKLKKLIKNIVVKC